MHESGLTKIGTRDGVSGRAGRRSSAIMYSSSFVEERKREYVGKEILTRTTCFRGIPRTVAPSRTMCRSCALSRKRFG